MKKLTGEELMLIKMLLISEKNKEAGGHALYYIQKIEKILEKIS